MQARRKDASGKLRSSRAHATRVRLIKMANQILHGMNINSDNSVGTTKNERFVKYRQPMPMDINEEIREANDEERVGSSVFATMTKPAMHKYQQKQLGAKKLKKHEFAANNSFATQSQ